MTIPRQWALRRRMMMAALGGVDVAAMTIEGSCTFTDYGVVTMSDDNKYRLIAVTGSGNIVFSSAVNCEVCVVGGGGGNGQSHMQVGGPGAYMKNQNVEAFEGGTVVVGAAKGSSSINDISVNAVTNNVGGTGGGGFSWLSQAGSAGDGLIKYPFNDDSYELWAGKPHCAGGGGGGYFHPSNGTYKGGNGGTNGGNGSSAIEGDSSAGGSGGSYGGGAGGPGSSYSTSQQGKNATYYGSGGGGQGYCNGYYTGAYEGVGYQGIVYVRIPVNQSLLAA